ncbi:hypothetical protein [Croceicoccus gelatinilyticus]|uniref:hypothetical protein n=1 Tax=Croceicoccus gelatinilyticus TaxID=2835536 RepID=UPI001BCFEE76|nr:hypothetical protein [Croceicoccus gelatinilyticus]MBS7671614.1 hypothetical protein [Croceicoccus gelatinilyticus]
MLPTQLFMDTLSSFTMLAMADHLKDNSESEQERQEMAQAVEKLIPEYADRKARLIAAFRSDPYLTPAQAINATAEVCKPEVEENILPMFDTLVESLHNVVRLVEAPAEPVALSRKDKLKRGAWIAAGVAVVALYFGAALHYKIDTTQELDTREGIIGRAQAWQKVIGYDDLMGTRVRSGGIFKPILFWPASPNDAEVAYAADYASQALGIADTLDEIGTTCGRPPMGDENRFSDAELAYLKESSDWILTQSHVWNDEDPGSIMADYAKIKFRCSVSNW